MMVSGVLHETYKGEKMHRIASFFTWLWCFLDLSVLTYIYIYKEREREIHIIYI